MPQVQVRIDTAIVDEAGCVAEMAVPALLRLAPRQLVLVGDHLQVRRGRTRGWELQAGGCASLARP